MVIERSVGRSEGRWFKTWSLLCVCCFHIEREVDATPPLRKVFLDSFPVAVGISLTQILTQVW